MSDEALSQLSDLRGCAYRLGVAFGAAAEQAETHDRKMEFFHAFDRCFFSVRVAVALGMRLRREAASTVGAERQVERDESVEQEPSEGSDASGRPERYDERDREREVERASFPLLLRTLQGVAADAAPLLGPPPAELLTLRELLAKVTAGPPAVAPRSTGGALRPRLAGSAATVTLPRPGPRTALRDATGPPPS